MAKCGRGHTSNRRLASGHCAECAVENSRAWALVNPEKRREHQRKYQRGKALRERTGVLAAYGGACTCCGESREPFLVIDHVDGGGAEHRRSIGRGGTTFYRWLRIHGYPPGFQVLCANCNTAKERGVCPHQLEQGVAGLG